MNQFDANDAVALATALYREGNYRTVVELLSGRLCETANNASALRLLGLARIRLGDSQAGATLLARAAALAPHDPETLLQYGIGLLSCGRVAEAAVLFE